MITKQFQYEPKQAAGLSFTQEPHTARFGSDAKSRFTVNHAAFEPGLAAVPSLMLGLLLRGWLADSEKLFLDRLAPHKSITFLIHGNHYLHPEDVPLFPYELIETAIRQKTTAVFTHLFCPSTSRDTHRYKIMTAVVNPEADSPVVFGLFGPEPVISEPRVENRFMETSACFRKAYSAARSILPKLGNPDDPETPLLVINRASGRILFLNKAATELCDADEKQLIDTEFSQARGNLSGLLLDRKLQIRNMTESDLNLSEVTVGGTPGTERDSAHLASFLVHKLRERVDHSGVVGQDKDIKQDNSLLRNIDELQWLLDPTGHPPCRVNLLYELDQAIQNTTSATQTEYPVRLVKRAQELYCQGPAGGYRSLFEAVLSAHGVSSPVALRTTITLDADDAGSLLTARFATGVNAEESAPDFVGGWEEYATGLARLLGVDISHRSIKKDHKLLTEITFGTSENR